MIAGLPMLQRVIEGARRAKRLRDVIVATDDPRIAEACGGFGAPVVMTLAGPPDRHRSAGRGERRELADAIVVNVQGDEPLIEGFVIDAAVAALEADAEAPMSTVVHRAEPARPRRSRTA